MRPCRASHIALLAPTGTNLWIYERALEERGISLASQAGKSFYRRQEVQDLIAVARTIADRHDTLALGALLRSSCRAYRGRHRGRHHRTAHAAGWHTATASPLDGSAGNL